MEKALEKVDASAAAGAQLASVSSAASQRNTIMRQLWELVNLQDLGSPTEEETFSTEQAKLLFLPLPPAGISFTTHLILLIVKSREMLFVFPHPKLLHFLVRLNILSSLLFFC